MARGDNDNGSILLNVKLEKKRVVSFEVLQPQRARWVAGRIRPTEDGDFEFKKLKKGMLIKKEDVIVLGRQT